MANSNVNIIITIKISTCITKERAIKEGILNKVFLQVNQADQGIEGPQIHQRQV